MSMVFHVARAPWPRTWTRSMPTTTVPACVPCWFRFTMDGAQRGTAPGIQSGGSPAWASSATRIAIRLLPRVSGILPRDLSNKSGPHVATPCFKRAPKARPWQQRTLRFTHNGNLGSPVGASAGQIWWKRSIGKQGIDFCQRGQSGGCRSVEFGGITNQEHLARLPNDGL